MNVTNCKLVGSVGCMLLLMDDDFEAISLATVSTSLFLGSIRQKYEQLAYDRLGLKDVYVVGSRAAKLCCLFLWGIFRYDMGYSCDMWKVLMRISVRRETVDISQDLF